MNCPGAYTTDNRLQEWRSLLGITNGNEKAKFEEVSQQEILKNTKTRVINQDVLRTRADEPFFKTRVVQSVLRQTLIRFCSYHRIEYMQGLNEILAPILTLNTSLTTDIEQNAETLFKGSGSADNDDELIDARFTEQLLMFERLMARLSPTTFSTRGVDAIQVQLTTFQLLLMYHEPVLAIILRKEGMTPDIYAMSWLITLSARRQPVSRALHIWDILLQLNTPHICVYLAVALLRSRKDAILSNCADVLPETLVALKFESDEEIDAVFADALQLMCSTPASVTAELQELGFSTKLTERERERGLKDLWHRPCLMAGAHEIALSLASAGDTGNYSSNSSAQNLADSGAATSTTQQQRHLRYLVLDCRQSVERQLTDALFIEGSVTVPPAVQEEICSLARQKSLLLDHGDEDLGGGVDPCDIERSFAKQIGHLSTRAASVLTLLWSAFVTHTSEEVHFAIADDSTGPYECADGRTSPLNTSYALPYHTASGSENLPLRERTTSEHTENLPQYLTNSGLLASNASTASFASALVLLGFPRVSIVQALDLQKEQDSDAAFFSCTENNSFSSLPSMKTELRSSSFTCLVHYLGACGVAPVVINPKYSHLQTAVDYHKEYQVCAFVHELRTATISYGVIDQDFYSGYYESQREEMSQENTSSATSATTPMRASGTSSTQLKVSSLSIVAAVITSAAKPMSERTSGDGATPGRGFERNGGSSSALSSFASALSALAPGSTPTSRRREQAAEAVGAATSAAARGSSKLSTNATLMQVKLSCTLNTLYKLLLIMSAQKKQHIVRLVTTYFYHSCVPSMRQYSPSAKSPLSEESDASSQDYLYLLGPPPRRNPHGRDMVYYNKLLSLLALRDTLKEVVSAQRLNAVVDKTSNKASTKMRLLKSSVDQSARCTARSIAGLSRKTTLRSTQQRLAEEAALKDGGAAAGEHSALWKTTQDLSGFFRSAEDGLSDSRSSSALRDSLSLDVWDQRQRSRVDSSDSVGLNSSDLL